MDGIYETNDKFPFDQLTLTAPTLLQGGNHFIKFRINEKPLYIQPPKCKTKQGIVGGNTTVLGKSELINTKINKRMYCDLMFTNENESFIRWMENLENYSQTYIFDNRAKWFETDLELNDIENSFTPPLKLYKSGKYYIMRTNVASALGKCILKIYDENGNEISNETLLENSNIMTVLEIQGIKCSVRSFQIEIELKQIMTMPPANIFEKCIFKTKQVERAGCSPLRSVAEVSDWNTDVSRVNISVLTQDSIRVYDNDNDIVTIKDDEVTYAAPVEQDIISSTEQNGMNPSNSDVNLGNMLETFAESADLANNSGVNDFGKNPDTIINKNILTPSASASQWAQSAHQGVQSLTDDFYLQKSGSLQNQGTDGLIESETFAKPNVTEPDSDLNQNITMEISEVELDLDNIEMTETVKLKDRSDVYYTMYRDARRNAKIARDLALSSYLEAKRIKNTYMLEDIDSESDLEDESNVTIVAK